MFISNRALQGQPTLPYTDNIIWANQDVFVTLSFVDRLGVPVIPTSLAVECDDLTNAIDMFGPIQLPSGGGTANGIISPAFAAVMTIQIQASLWNMSYPYQGSQICQLNWVAIAPDSTTSNPFQTQKVDIVSLCSIATVSGNVP